jgi:putative sterol carrier protein
VKEVFEKMPQAFRAEKAAGVNVVFQYTIAGEGGGEWFAEIREGTCKVEAGKHATPTCTLAIAAGDFLDLMNGKLPAMQAYTSGKLKIGGDIMKSQLIEKLFKL